MILYAGNIYKGYFENDERHGYGVMLYSTNETCEEMWENGQLIEEHFIDQAQPLSSNSYDYRPVKNTHRSERSRIPPDNERPAQ